MQSVEINGKDVGKNVGASRWRIAGLEQFAGIACSLVLALSSGSTLAQRTGPGDPIALSSLPREAHQTQQLILAGGPFPYLKDGEVFANREGGLEPCPRRFTHEYTVPTPGAKERGAGAWSAAAGDPRNPRPVFIPKTTTTVFIGS